MVIFTGCSLSFAQDIPLEVKKMQEQLKVNQKKHLEMLKQTDPQMYEQMVKQDQLSEKISQVSSDYFKQKISYESAKAKLYPLVKEDMVNQINNLDDEIQMIEKKLEELKKSKTNPDYLIYQQIDIILGKSLPRNISRQSM
jgi:hypothetical protein